MSLFEVPFFFKVPLKSSFLLLKKNLGSAKDYTTPKKFFQIHSVCSFDSSLESFSRTAAAATESDFVANRIKITP